MMILEINYANEASELVPLSQVLNITHEERNDRNSRAVVQYWSVIDNPDDKTLARHGITTVTVDERYDELREMLSPQDRRFQDVVIRLSVGFTSTNAN